jgi:hypothetical protein
MSAPWILQQKVTCANGPYNLTCYLTQYTIVIVAKQGRIKATNNCKRKIYVEMFFHHNNIIGLS